MRAVCICGWIPVKGQHGECVRVWRVWLWLWVRWWRWWCPWAVVFCFLCDQVISVPRSAHPDPARSVPSLLTSSSGPNTWPLPILEGAGRVSSPERGSEALLSHIEVLLSEQGSVWAAI